MIKIIESGDLSVITLIYDKCKDATLLYDLIFKCDIKKINVDIIRFLENKDVDLQIQKDGYYAFRISAERGNLNMVKYYHEKKSDIHALNDYALRWASNNGHYEIVKYLVEEGANISADNFSSIKWAEKNGHNNIINYLKKRIITPSAPPVGIENIYELNKTCEICMEADVNIKLPCLHMLCNNCYKKIDKINKLCPFCRSELNLVNTDKL